MPLYDLVCSMCQHKFEHSQSIHEPLLKTCPVCKQDSLYQDFSARRLSTRVCLIYGEPTTVGQQAELNRKKMGEEQFRMKEEEMAGPHLVKQKNTDPPWWRDDQKQLNLSEIKDVNKFIITGDKS